MCRIWFLAVVAVFFASFSHAAEKSGKQVSLAGIPTVAGAIRAAPPAWAVMQRRLIEAVNEAAHVMYLAGLNPSWPERIMAGEIDRVARAVARIRSGRCDMFRG